MDAGLAGWDLARCGEGAERVSFSRLMDGPAGTPAGGGCWQLIAFEVVVEVEADDDVSLTPPPDSSSAATAVTMICSPLVIGIEERGPSVRGSGLGG